ncbi:MAG: hypothetical protein ABIJ92_04025 [Candidatus Aenigmatarchaeota archaeon]
MRKRSKAQSAAEFMIIFMMLIIVLSLAAWISSTKTQEVNTIKTNRDVGVVLNVIVSKIDTAFLEGDGFSTDMYLPANITSVDYTVQIVQNQVLITHRGLTYSKRLLTDDVQGSTSKGFNMIRNVDGTVIIS